jgi:8-oxo-dGTP pyrophosphatase MutT (NUDIX family)
MFHQCKLPITSYGIILFRSSTEGLQFLMIRRKDSFGYIDFIRGKYSPYNIEQIKKSVDEMSIQEKERILSLPFEKLWNLLWGDNKATQYKGEEISSMKKFETIHNGVNIDSQIINLREIVENSKTDWLETEWEFPKGRRNYMEETDLFCALREFEEETGIPSSNISVIENLLPFEELFVGSNHKAYKNKYFVAYINMDIDSMNNFQKAEVSKLEWKTFAECLDSIRPYNLEKKNLITKINKMLLEYTLYY